MAAWLSVVRLQRYCESSPHHPDEQSPISGAGGAWALRATSEPPSRRCRTEEQGRCCLSPSLPSGGTASRRVQRSLCPAPEARDDSGHITVPAHCDAPEASERLASREVERPQGRRGEPWYPCSDRALKNPDHSHAQSARALKNPGHSQAQLSPHTQTSFRTSGLRSSLASVDSSEDSARLRAIDAANRMPTS